VKGAVRIFTGMRPSQEVDLLAPGEAQLATNCRFSSGALEPLLGLATPGAGVTFSGGTVLSTYRYGQSSSSEVLYWFQFTGDVDVVKGPIDNDTEERTYWTDGTYPKKANSTMATAGPPYPGSSYRMGIPAPATALTATVSGSATNPADPAETVTYTVTYVSAWGEEGPPSPTSTAVSWRPGQQIDITALAVAPGGAYSILSKRIYRSATSSTSTKFQLVNTEGDIAIATTTYTDSKLTAVLGEVLATTGWVEPADTMIGLTAMANGVMAGFFGNTVCFSEPYAPYAWPVRYRQSTNAPIVGIAAFDQSLFVGTTQGIYIFTGLDPANMSSQLLAEKQSCVSKRSVVPMLGGVMFASPDGLWYCSGGGLTHVTKDLLSRDDWQAYVPSSITAFETENRYLAFYNTGSVTAGLVFEFAPKATFSKTDLYATAGYRDLKGDALYLVVSNVLKKFDAGTALTLDWTSGVDRLQSEVNFSCARVDADTYPVTFKVYADGTLKHTQTVTNKYAFRLPGGYRSARYHFQLTSAYKVRSFEYATTMQELTQSG
jgi:hypothetical protein